MHAYLQFLVEVKSALEIRNLLCHNLRYTLAKRAINIVRNAFSALLVGSSSSIVCNLLLHISTLRFMYTSVWK
jgi:hypothetical protein